MKELLYRGCSSYLAEKETFLSPHRPPVSKSMKQNDSRIREEKAGHINCAPLLLERQDPSKHATPNHHFGYLNADLSTETFFSNQQWDKEHRICHE
ncbi:hypothetical protein J6590_026133 [Homalodisca vitripennis]|nr:hypothetical protein J6590_026133 [Homalodisca vitripennis]